MKKLKILTFAFLSTVMMVWSQAAFAAGTQTTTVSSLMNVLKEDKQKAVYNINLNAPFSKETSGIRESVSTETGEVSVVNTIFDIPGRSGMNLSLTLEYRSRDAKAYNEGTKSSSLTNNYGQNIVAWYDVFDANGYWLKTGGLIYPAGYTIEAQTTLDGQKWVFTGNLQYENGTSMFTGGTMVNTTVENSKDQAAKYAFGAGWSMEGPSLEVDGETVYATLPNGQTYKADFTTGTGLADYELTDVVFTKDTSYGNGVDQSAYKIYFVDGSSYYFSATGDLLVVMDRFRNAVRYYYEDVNGLRLLTKVVDSVGRAIDIQYNDTVTIFKSGDKIVKLVKTPIPGTVNKFYLSSFVDELGREIKYKYTFQELAFNQIGGTSANNLYANLIEISYPTGAKTQYVYDKSTKNLGASGSMEYFKVKERKDVDGERIYNQLKYQYFNEPDGYPTYKVDAIDELYKYYSVVTDSKGIATKYLYNAKHLQTTTTQYSNRIFSDSTTQYHPISKVPIRQYTKFFNEKGDYREKLDMYEYDSRGNLIMENHPETPEQAESDEYKVFYSYDFAYNLMTGKRFKQNKDTTVELQYQLTPDKKNVATAITLGNEKELNRQEFEYDDYGNLTVTRVEKEPGEWVTTRYEFGTDYKGAYPTAQIAEGVKDADGNKRTVRVEMAYDFATGNVISQKDGNGNTTTLKYDLLGRVLTENAPDKAQSSYTYDDANNILEVTNAKGNKLVYHYDGLGKLQKVMEPSKNIQLVELEYDDNENQISETDGNKNLKKLAYDELERLVGVSNLDRTGKVLSERQVSYDDANLDRFGTPFFKVTVTEKGDKQDRVNNYYFDNFERLAKLGRVNGSKEDFAYYKYDYLGNQVEAVDFAGQKSTFYYDALSQLIKSTDAQGTSSKFKYDSLGNLIAQTNPIGQTVSFEYDSLGRKIIDKAPFEAGKYSVTKYYYDNAGNLSKLVDPEGFVTKQHYNNRNMLTAVERVLNSKESNITKYDYDQVGNITKVHKGLNSFQDKDFSTYGYYYDQFNQLVKMTDAAGRETRYEYDNNGNLVELFDRNKVSTTFSYDGLNRLVYKQNSKDGKKNGVQISYDKLGQTRQMADASGTTIFDYDSLGRLTTINYGNGIRQNYSYDKADRISNLVVTQGSAKEINLGYQYDKVGRLTRVNNNGKSVNYKYDAAGKLMEELNGVTGVKSEYQYYPSGSMKSLRHFNGEEIVSSYEYKYDKRGNQTQKDEGQGTTKYYYDALSRLEVALMPDRQIQNYEYDDLDNIRELTEIKGTSVQVTNYKYDKDSRLLLQDTERGADTEQKRFLYDANGNQTEKDEVIKRNGSLVSSKTTRYDYDGYNQLSRVRQDDGKFVEYTYNGTGLRTKKDFGDKSINYYYNGGNIILETDETNKVTAKNIRGLRLISRETPVSTFFYLHNAHGDVTQLLDEKGQIIKDYRYDPYGNEEDEMKPTFGGKQTQELWRKEVEKIDNPFRYCGEYLDEETGNYYLRARYYDPSIQRFINEDSYGVSRGTKWNQHLYGYSANNPINFIDPSGHSFRRLSYGASGKDVEAVQRLLMAVGYKLPNFGADGHYGNETIAAVNQFKKDYNLTNTGKDYGVFGPTSLRYLETVAVELGVKPVKITSTKSTNTTKSTTSTSVTQGKGNSGTTTPAQRPFAGTDNSTVAIQCHNARDGKGEKIKYVAPPVAYLTVVASVLTGGSLAGQIIANEDKIPLITRVIPNISNSQVGKKLVDHAVDYGLSLSKEGALAYRSITESVLRNANTIRVGNWKTLGECEFWIYQNNVAIVKGTEWVTTFPLTKPGTVEYITNLPLK